MGFGPDGTSQITRKSMPVRRCSGGGGACGSRWGRAATAAERSVVARSSSSAAARADVAVVDEAFLREAMVLRGVSVCCGIALLRPKGLFIVLVDCFTYPRMYTLVSLD